MLHFLNKEKGISALLLLLFATSLISLRVSAQDVVVSALHVNNVELEGLNYGEAEELLSSEFEEYFSEPVVFNLAGDLQTTTLNELGFSLDAEATVEAVFEEVHGESIVDHFGNRLKNVLLSTNVEPVVLVDNDSFTQRLRELYPKLTGAKDAIVFVNDAGEIEVIPHEHSVLVDFDRLAETILAQVIEGNFTQEVELQTYNDFAGYTLGDAQQDAALLENYIGRELIASFDEGPEIDHDYTITLSLAWIEIRQGQVSFDEEAIKEYVEKTIAPDFEVIRSDATIKALPTEGIWAEVEGFAIDGRSLNLESSVKNIVSAFGRNATEAELVMTYDKAEIINDTGVDLGDLERIGEGRSGFWGSDWGRRFNIKKGLEEKVNSIILAPGAEYSFNDNLGAVEYSNGWAGAKAIFGGADLETVPGGGLCQVSTTLYRAALDADLEILERFSHTLYVYYYEEFGNGLDATIYPGFRDLRLKNNTENYLFIQAYSEDEYGYVNIYGTSEKEVDLIGPIYAGRVPEEYQDRMNLQWNEIGWVKEVWEEQEDGSVEITEEMIITKYKTAPRKMYGVESQ